MAGIQDKDTLDALGTLSDNLLLVINQLKDGENTREKDNDFDAVRFWERFGLTFKAVSAEATKLAMAFSSEPLPDARGTETLAGGVEKSSLAMLSAFYSLPKTQGQALHQNTLSTVLCILNSVQSLVDVIKAEGSEGSKRQLQSTGGVWEYCDSFPGLPKNNKDAVLKEAREQSDLVKDALEEIESAINEDEDDDYEAVDGEDRWSDADHALLNPALGLIKAARSTAKKTTLAIRDNAKCTDEATVTELDELSTIMAQVSPAVDDFVLSLYPPLKDDGIKDETRGRVEVLKDKNKPMGPNQLKQDIGVEDALSDKVVLVTLWHCAALHDISEGLKVLVMDSRIVWNEYEKVRAVYVDYSDNIIGQKLTDVLLCLLGKIRNSHVAAKADAKWIDFLSKAVNHNHDKMIELLPE